MVRTRKWKIEFILIYVNKKYILFFRVELQKVLTWRKNIFFKKYQFEKR
jgi:hypothetical protein